MTAGCTCGDRGICTVCVLASFEAERLLVMLEQEAERLRVRGVRIGTADWDRDAIFQAECRLRQARARVESEQRERRAA